MIVLFKLIILTVMLTIGWKIVTAEGMLLQRVGDFFKKKVDEGNKVYDLFVCAWCSNTFWIWFAHLFAFGLGILPLEFNWQLIIRIPLIICGASFVSGNTWNLYETINRIKERNELQADYYYNKINQDGKVNEESKPERTGNAYNQEGNEIKSY